MPGLGSVPLAGDNGGDGGGGSGGGGEFSTAVVARYPADATLNTLLGEADRAYFLIVNESVTDLFVALASTVNTGGGTESASIVLPGGVSAGYDLAGYKGPISFKYASGADSATGYALVTRGYEP